jgi:hypothetical protein
MIDLDAAFDTLMYDIYRRAKAECKYNANDFLHMLDRDRGVLTAKRLINAPKQSDGYTNLFMLGRLDLTVEAMLWENKKFWPLFDEADIEAARKRLDANGYFKS